MKILRSLQDRRIEKVENKAIALLKSKGMDAAKAHVRNSWLPLSKANNTKEKGRMEKVLSLHHGMFLADRGFVDSLFSYLAITGLYGEDISDQLMDESRRIAASQALKFANDRSRKGTYDLHASSFYIQTALLASERYAQSIGSRIAPRKIAGIWEELYKTEITRTRNLIEGASTDSGIDDHTRQGLKKYVGERRKRLEKLEGELSILRSKGLLEKLSSLDLDALKKDGFDESFSIYSGYKEAS